MWLKDILETSEEDVIISLDESYKGMNSVLELLYTGQSFVTPKNLNDVHSLYTIS